MGCERAKTQEGGAGEKQGVHPCALKAKKNKKIKNKHLLTDYILDGNFYSTKTEAFIALISLSAHVEKSLKFPKSFCEQFNALVTILNPLSLESHNLLKVSQTILHVPGFSSKCFLSSVHWKNLIPQA